MKSLVTILLLSSVLFGCTSSGSGFQKFYKNSSPEKFSPTTNAVIFNYSDPCNSYQIYKTFFENYLILGMSSFNSPDEDFMDAKEFAMSIGSDVLIVHGKYTETTKSGKKRYDINSIFLKNVKNIKPIFERTNVDYPKKGVSGYDGMWSNIDYKIEIYASDKSVIGINKIIINEESRKWKPNQVKFIIFKFNKKYNGIYFMRDHRPVPAQFKINNLGYLEILTDCAPDDSLIQLKKIEGGFENVEELKNKDANFWELDFWLNWW